VCSSDLISVNIETFLLILRVSAIAGIMGLFTRSSMTIQSLTYILVYAFHYSNFDAPVPWIYGWFPLIVLALSRCGDSFSLDVTVNRLLRRARMKSANVTESDYRWPLEIIRLWFVYIYFSAGLSKLLPLSGVITWIQHSPLQEILVYRYPYSNLYYIFGRPLFDYSLNVELLALGNLAAITLELTTFVMVVTKKFDLPIVLGITSMHFVLWLVGVPNFGLASFVLITAILIGLVNRPVEKT
jgi:hypothetical protein